jgi:hypothetical protein
MADLNKIKTTFQTADSVGSGFLPTDKLIAVFSSLGGWSDAECRKLLAAYGEGGSGKVNYVNFVDWLSGKPVQGTETRTFGQAQLKLPKNMTDLEMFERTEDTPKRKCKIICTMPVVLGRRQTRRAN